MVTIDGVSQMVPSGITLEDLAAGVASNYKEPIVLAVMNGKLAELFRKPEDQARIQFLTTETDSGYMTFRRSASFVMLKAFQDVVGKENNYLL